MQQTIELIIHDERIHDWQLPRYMTPMSAGIDLFACLNEPLFLKPQESAILIPSGIALLMNNPEMMAMIVPRSGQGHKRGLILGNSMGIIDADYTAMIMVSVWNRNPQGEPIQINPGDRIAQLIFLPIIRANLKVVTQFSDETERGSGGFGSTGI